MPYHIIENNLIKSLRDNEYIIYKCKDTKFIGMNGVSSFHTFDELVEYINNMLLICPKEPKFTSLYYALENDEKSIIQEMWDSYKDLI